MKNIYRYALYTLVIFLFIGSFSLKAQAQNQTEAKASEISVQYAERVSRNCLRGWKSQQCLSALSETALALTANYAALLERSRQESHLETLKNDCAAATAAMEGRYPADAMNSAFTECANTIYDISEATSISPDLSHYQLLIGGVLCLSGQPQCTAIEQGLRRYK